MEKNELRGWNQKNSHRSRRGRRNIGKRDFVTHCLSLTSKPGRFTLFLNNTNTNAILLSIGTIPIQYNAISFSIDYNSSQYKNVYRMMQGYVWIVIAIMKKMYMIYKMHKETFCFVRLLGNSLILIHTIYWRNCFGLIG